MGYPHNSNDQNGWRRGARGIDTNDGWDFTWLTPKEVKEYINPMYQGGLKQPKIVCEYKEKAANPRDLVESAQGGMGSPYIIGNGRDVWSLAQTGVKPQSGSESGESGRFRVRGFGATEHG